jgi:hypothetical protein
MSVESKDLQGVQLYKPGVLAAYLALGGLPVGLFLYGLNLTRRGQRSIGYVLCALSTVIFAMIAVVVSSGGRVSGIGFLAVLVAILVYKMESRSYKLALSRGATPAKWWPPLFGVIGFVLAIIVVAGLFTPDEAFGLTAFPSLVSR